MHIIACTHDHIEVSQTGSGEGGLRVRPKTILGVIYDRPTSSFFEDQDFLDGSVDIVQNKIISVTGQVGSYPPAIPDLERLRGKGTLGNLVWLGKPYPQVTR